jgi:two-component system cell cycle sensor histidine kinase/response regulator CckA
MTLKRYSSDKGTVLIMDDEASIRVLFSHMLPRLGYEVELSKDGTEAIESYRKAMESATPFVAVLFDLTVRGGMGGMETIQRLKEIDPDVKGIACSAHGGSPVMTDYKEYSFCAAIAKPFSISALGVLLDEIVTEKGGDYADR